MGYHAGKPIESVVYCLNKCTPRKKVKFENLPPFDVIFFMENLRFRSYSDLDLFLEVVVIVHVICSGAP